MSHKEIFNFKQHLSSHILAGYGECTIQMLILLQKKELSRYKTRVTAYECYVPDCDDSYSRIALILPVLQDATNNAVQID